MACKDAKGKTACGCRCRCDGGYTRPYAGFGGCRCDAIVIDTAHGHSKYVIEKLKEAKETLPEH